MLAGKRILLVVTGGIAAYKTLELARRLRERGATVRAVLTAAGARFVTPLSLAAITGEKVFEDLFSLTDEAEMGHIRLSREADLLVVAPASADFLAKMAQGRADDLASTVLLATDKPVLVAPAMNVRMWRHAATQANIDTLRARGVAFVGPDEGDMACGEFGPGRLAEPAAILETITASLTQERRLSGLRALVTSGPTHEPIDPVRYIANRSSGKQGHAIAQALSDLGAATTLVTGPTGLSDPTGATVIPVESAREMLAACEAALPADIAVCAAAVADWRVSSSADQKLKKAAGGPPTLALTENPDILASLAARSNDRPRLVIGFAAETEKVIEAGRAKREKKGCDWILANDVSPMTGTFGGDSNEIHLLRNGTVESWPRLTKQEVGRRLAAAIADQLAPEPLSPTKEDQA